MQVLFVVLVAAVLGNADSLSNLAYSHDSSISVAGGSNWMSRLKDTTPLNRISIPGTHDSVSFHSGGIPTDLVETQTVPLKQQLENGIRALDIRCRHFRNSFPIHHGFVFQKTYFNNVLDTVVDFLKANPTETILMRVKEEYKAAENNRNFKQTFDNYISNIQTHVWTPKNANPSLGEVRGKIVFLDDFSSGRNGITKYGIDYKALKNQIQDEFAMSTMWKLYRKWENVKGHLIKADKSRSGFYINYLSGASVANRPGLVRPFFVASGHVSPSTSSKKLPTGRTTRDKEGKGTWADFPRDKCVLGLCLIYFQGTNVLTYKFIKKNNLNFVGIIFADFPGSGLVNQIISLNK